MHRPTTQPQPNKWNIRGGGNLEYSFVQSIHSSRVNGDSYSLGGSNPFYEQRSQRISSIKSVIPSELPPIEFKRGWIEDYVYYSEMLDYYQARQLILITRRDVTSLQQLEGKFYRTYFSKPEIGDYNSDEEFKTDAARWIERERMRINDGFSPYCLPAAKQLMGRINVNRDWAERHTKIVDDYEKLIANNYNRLSAAITWTCNNSRFDIG